MASRDYRHRETKKPKKETKKLPAAEIVSPPVTVEVVGKKKRKEE